MEADIFKIVDPLSPNDQASDFRARFDRYIQFGVFVQGTNCSYTELVDCGTEKNVHALGGRVGEPRDVGHFIENFFHPLPYTIFYIASAVASSSFSLSSKSLLTQGRILDTRVGLASD